MTHRTATDICVNPSNQAWLDFVLPGGVGRRFLSLSCYFRAPYTDSFSSQVCVCEPKWTRKWEDTILRFLHGGVPKFPIAAQLFNLTWCEAVYKTKQNIHLINGLTAECEVMWFDSNGDQCLVKEMDRNAYIPVQGRQYLKLLLEAPPGFVLNRIRSATSRQVQAVSWLQDSKRDQYLRITGYLMPESCPAPEVSQYPPNYCSGTHNPMC